MRRFPIHGHANSCATAGMIEKDKFLQRRRIEFAISAEFERHFRHAIRFPGSIDSKSVCFAFCDAYDRVEKRGGDENQRAEYQDEQWKPGRIGNAPDAPFFAPAPDSCIEELTSKRESD